jgi:hypothetical protein
MKIAGRFSVGTQVFELAPDTKRVGRYKMPQSGRLSKLTAYLDGLGSGSIVGPQPCKAVVYDTSNKLLAVSDEVVIAGHQPSGWVDFRFSAAHGRLLLPDTDFYGGIHAGGTTATIRVAGSGPSGMGGKHNADAYADGPADPFGAATTDSADLSLFVTYFSPYSPPNESDLYYSRLPLAESQQVFGATGVDKSLGERVLDVTWHSTFLDVETGANALVRDGSPLAALLGERIRLRTTTIAKPRTVYAYVHDLMSPDSAFDLSVTRLLFSRLGALAEDSIPLLVDVMGTS